MMPGPFLIWRCSHGGTTTQADVERAIARFEEHFFRRPTVCLANPSLVVETPTDVRLIRSQRILSYDLWLGVEEVQQNEI